MDQVWKGLSKLDSRNPGGFIKKKTSLSVKKPGIDYNHKSKNIIWANYSAKKKRRRFLLP